MYTPKSFPSMHPLLLLAAFLLLVAGACTSENTIEGGGTTPPEPLPGKDAVQIVLSTPKNPAVARADNSSNTPIGFESYIKNVRVLFFKQESAESENWILELNEMQEVEKDLLTETEPLKITLEGVKNRDARRMVFVIANWMDYPAGALKIGVSTAEDFTMLFSKITRPIPTPSADAPLLMFGLTGAIFTEGPAVIDLTRLVAKINLKVVISSGFANSGLLKPDYLPGYLTNGQRDDEPGSQPGAYLQRVPNSVYVYPKPSFPPGYELMEYEDLKPVSNPSVFELTDTYYVYPNYVPDEEKNDKSKGVNVFLSLPLRLADTSVDPEGTLLRKNYYNVVLYDPREGRSGCGLLPNHIYNLTITIDGFGSEDDGAIPSLIPEEWPLTELPADVPIYSLGINKSSVSFAGATNRELVVSSNHLPLVTVTSLDPSLVTASFSTTTGVITLTRQGGSGTTQLKVKLVNLTRAITVTIK